MSFASRFTRRRVALGAAVGVLAAAAGAGLALPSGAQAAPVYLSYQTKSGASFLCWEFRGCQAGGPGFVGGGVFISPATSTIGRWPRTFIAKCQTDAGVSHSYQGTVLDRNWSGTWRVQASDTNSAGAGNLPWC